MKKILLMGLSIITVFSLYAAAVQFGMTGAVKTKVNGLDNQVRAYKKQQAEQQQQAQLQKELAVDVITGVASEGAPFKQCVITLKDLLGHTTTTITDVNGNFTIHVSTYPMLLEIKDTLTGNTHFSIAYASGTTNIHPLTDLIMRQWMRQSLAIADLKGSFEAAHSSASISSFPVQDDIRVLSGIVADFISDALYRNDLDPATFDLFSSTFQANGSGFDACIDQLMINAAIDFSQIAIIDSITTSSSTFVVGLPTANTAPVPPAGWTPTAREVGARSLLLTWAPVPGAAGYAVFRNGARIRAVCQPYLADFGLTPGTQYQYYVVAIGWGGKRSAPSGALTVTTRSKFAILKDSQVRAGNLTYDMATSNFVLPYIDIKTGQGIIMAQFASTVTANVPLVNVSNTFNVFAAMQDNCIGLKHGGTNYFLVWVSTSNALNGAHIDPVSGACDGVINILPDNSLSAGYLGDIEYDSFSQNYFITSESYSSGNCSVLETIVNQGGAVVSSFTVVSNADILNPPRAASNPSAGQCLVAWGVTNQGVYGAVVSSAGINVSQFVIDASATLRGAPTASPAFDGANYLVVYKANTVSTSPAANALDTAVHSYVKGRFVSQSGSALNMAFTASIDPLITHYLPCAAYDKLNNLYIVTWSNWLYTPLAMTRAGYFDTSGRRLGDLFNTDFAAPGENVVVSEPHITSNGTTKTSSLGIMHGYFDTSKYPPVPAGSAYEGYDIEFIQ